MTLREPLSPALARRLIRDILTRGEVVSSRHASEEMARDALDLVDCVAVLRSGTVEPAELEGGTWRYRVRARDVWVVVAFRSEHQLVIVTAWRRAR
jgi:hypothetical protein